VAAAHGIVAEVLDHLDETRFGDWEGLSFTELDALAEWRSYNADRGRSRPPGGESLAEVQQRMMHTLDHLRMIHPDHWVVVVSHCDPLRTLICNLLGLSLDHLTRFEISPGSLSMAEMGAFGARVLSLNHTTEVLASRGSTHR
jgi:broad specificity phosphatase PhoE